jgi:hypothetical protein
MKALFGLLSACLAVFFAYLALFSSPGCSPVGPNTSKATSYTIYKVRDFSFPGRVRKNWLGYSAAIDFESRAQTAIKAALDIQQGSHADVVQVFLTTRNSGYELANAWYAKDGRGMNGLEDWQWKVTAVRGKPEDNFAEVYEVK